MNIKIHSNNYRFLVFSLVFVSALYFILGIYKEYGQTQFYDFYEHFIFIGYGICSFYSCHWALSRYAVLAKLSLIDNLKVLLISGAINAILSTIFFLLFRLSMTFIYDFEQWFPPLLGLLMNVVYTFFLIHLILASLLITYHNIRLNHRSELRRIVAEKDKSDLQLKQLQQQFTPHFLFNNLNILSSLIPMDTKLAAHYVQLLSSLYRFVTSHLNEELISLDEELEFVEHYSELMNIRFVDSYNVKIATNGQDKRKLLVVPGALQACVENAIKHNVASSDEPLLIDILLDDADKKIVVTNKIINKVHQLDISGVGINNLKQRYKAISDKPVEVTSDQSRFTISFPFINHTVE